MTTEEKAKAYDEALERARKSLRAASDVGTDIVTFIFPKLAESDDERITRAINNMLPFIPDDAYANNGVTKEQVLAWLKKRKDISKQIDAEVNRRVYDMIREAREKWDSKVDDAIARMDFDKSMEHWQYVGGVDLEEDKEEQKPIEPSDEELQRHQDELYDFKVFAAKQAKEHHISFVHDFEWNNFCEELLSYFNEKQKPVEIKIDNPNIQKIDPDVKISTSDSSADGDGLLCASWRDEKAEQNRKFELIKKSWYMEGYHDCEFGYEPKWIIKTGEGGPRYEENPKYGQHIEEKSAEWVLPEDFEEAVYKVANFISPFDNQEELRKTSHRFAEQLLSLAKKELDKPAEKQDYSGLNDFEQAIHRGFLCAGVVNVPVNIIKETAQDCLAHLPAEWSEDFDKEVENVHKRYPEVSYAKLTRIAYHFSKLANRCKGIEWSEEDEKMLNNIEYILHKDVSYTPPTNLTGSGNAYYTHQTEIDWLKSLRPSWKPSDK